MKEGLIKDAYELIIKEIQTIMTIFYLLMIGIGMIYNYKKYALFGINIFEYADVFDFLIAPFKDFRIIEVSFVVLLIGKTKEVIFLFTENKVKVIPITSLVKEIEIK